MFVCGESEHHICHFPLAVLSPFAAVHHEDDSTLISAVEFTNTIFFYLPEAFTTKRL